ncbi:S8 family peptidase [Bacillus amyloliquefaciens]|uniref:S8 family peptidase n=1 Tax=Bacillus amyloliquefaciens TaxID=1390 RepID=UPI0005EF33DD|nr:S8 family serine peptidase [Bacillus amyloliquefaciens]MDH3089663.1 S8 family serine peptidase [Bacillus amyloliquefaciens]
MKKFFATLLVLFSLTGCTSKYSLVTLSNGDCKTNWGLCTVFPNKEVKLYYPKNPIKVAVLDSGINSSMPIFENSSITSYDAIKNKSTTKDSLGHGTAIAGVIMAPLNKQTVQGISPQVKLFDVKVLNDKGGGEINDVINGINWCIKQEVDIINLSFGFQKDNKGLRNAINKAIEKNIIVIASAGNTLGLSTDYPAKYKNVISVSSINKNLKRDPFSAKGKIDFVAPGVQIPVYTPNDKVKTVNGTSFATAFATGVIANILSRNPDADRKSVINTLKNTAKDLGDKGPDQEYGYGLIQFN